MFSCFLSDDQAEQYAKTLIDCNVSGRVLLNCNLDELKTLSGMCFGDWELFRVTVLALREREFQSPRIAPQPSPANHPGPIGGGLLTSAGPPLHHQGSSYLHHHLLDVDFENGRLSRSSSLRSNTAFTAAAAG